MNAKKLIGALALAFAFVVTFSFSSQAQNLENASGCDVKYEIHYSSNCNTPSAPPSVGILTASTTIPMAVPAGSFVEWVKIESFGTHIVGFPGCGYNDFISNNSGCETCVDNGIFGWKLHYTGIYQDVVIECF